MRLLISRTSVEAKPEIMFEFVKAVADDIEFLRASYPHFDAWLLQKVIPGIYAGERTACVELRNSEVAGLLIVKHSQLESKLCTLRVRPHYESKGLGVRLFETAFDLLGTDRPLLSVSETSKAKFTRLFLHFGFAQEAVYEGRYLPKVDEFSYNGLLDLPTHHLPIMRTCSMKSSVISSSFSRHPI
jgi:ribosomal protein S18 acetylase RimI-like enzyme